MKREIWKTIENFPNYEVSNFGQIRNKTTKRFIKPYKTKRNFLLVPLQREGKAYCKTLGKLVLKTFIKKPQDKDQCNHKDGDRTNNYIENLEWVSAQENIHHAFANGMFRGRLQPDDVKRIRKLRKNKVSAKKLAEYFKCSESTISQIHNRKKWKFIK